jgi:hypothetical protein
VKPRPKPNYPALQAFFVGSPAPVTPEVAGSSPVAPVRRSWAKHRQLQEFLAGPQYTARLGRTAQVTV